MGWRGRHRLRVADAVKMNRPPAGAPKASPRLIDLMATTSTVRLSSELRGYILTELAAGHLVEWEAFLYWRRVLELPCRLNWTMRYEVNGGFYHAPPMTVIAL